MDLVCCGGLGRALSELDIATRNLIYFFSTPIDNPSLLKSLYINRSFSVRKIANRYNVSKTYILRLLNDYGITRRPSHKNGENTSIPPFGFTNHGNNRIENTEEQEAIAKILQMQSKKMSLRSIASTLDKEHIPARQGTQWHPQKIKRILERIENIERN